MCFLLVICKNKVSNKVIGLIVVLIKNGFVNLNVTLIGCLIVKLIFDKLNLKKKLYYFVLTRIFVSLS